MMRSNILSWMARAALACGRPAFIPIMLAGGRHAIDIGDNIAHSARFRRAAVANMSRTRATPTDRSKWTCMVWAKRGMLGVNQALFSGWQSVSQDEIYFNSSDQFVVAISGSTILVSNAVFRDTAAHGQFVVVFDGANTALLAMRVYYNGVEITSWATDNRNALGANSSWINDISAGNNFVGSDRTATDLFDGVISRMEFIDGQVLTPASFGRISKDTGAWVNKNYVGSYGLNGCSLRFAAVATASDFGIDSSGNSHNYTVNNLSATAGATYDWLLDTPTNNFATLNPLCTASNTITEANALITLTATTGWGNDATIALPASGKWYWEVTGSALTANAVYIGITPLGTAPSAMGANGYYYYGNSGNKIVNGVSTALGASYTNGDVIGVAYDAGAGALTVYKNNALQGTVITGLTAQMTPALVNNTSGGNQILRADFGQRPFTFTPPAGYIALSTTNLPTPAFIKPSKGFDINLRTGTGAAFSVTGKAFSPKLVWSKDRTATVAHGWYDSKRGAQKEFDLNNAGSAESTQTGGVTAFNADGFSGGSRANINTNGDAFIDYLFDIFPGAFDIQTYTQASSASQANAHNLGVAPECILYKDRVAATVFVGMHKGMGNMTSSYFAWNQQTIGSLGTAVSAPSSTQFFSSVNLTGVGDSGVAYLFASKPAFSAVGSYIGNGLADGPSVILDFKPKWIVFRNVSTSPLDATMYNTASSPFNICDKFVFVDTASAEQTGAVAVVDILSSGFKVRNSGSEMNNSGQVYVYIAFADTPFKYSTAR